MITYIYNDSTAKYCSTQNLLIYHICGTCTGGQYNTGWWGTKNVKYLVLSSPDTLQSAMVPSLIHHQGVGSRPTLCCQCLEGGQYNVLLLLLISSFIISEQCHLFTTAYITIYIVFVFKSLSPSPYFLNIQGQIKENIV